MLDEKQLQKVVMGAITDCINAHGAITKELKTSLAKRIVGQLKSQVKQR